MPLVESPVMQTSAPLDTSQSISPLYSPESSDSGSAILAAEDEGTKPKRASLRAMSIALERFRKNWSGQRNEVAKVLEDHILTVNTQVSSIAELVSPLSSNAGSSALKIVQYGSIALAEGHRELLKVLQTIASVHPFIGLAVSAFQVAIELDLKRRENDKKINLLFMEMRDMMTALVELEKVDGAYHDVANGKTIQERLQPIVDQIESDILRCANACDTYAKKSMLVKVFSCARWDVELQQYIKRFEKRRADVHLAIALHLGLNIDRALLQLDTLHLKMDRALSYLKLCTSPEERELAAFIKKRGGRQAILASDRLLLELISKPSSSICQDSDGAWRERQDFIDIEELRAALSEDPAISISRNSDAFERKFEMQERELVRIQEIVHEENGIVIRSLSSGPHDKIRDNRWRGSVKARHFVLALRDYCLEKLDKLGNDEQTFVDCDRPTKITEHDEWTLEYISITRLQAIIEAFDDDASGFITVAEVNTFTSSKPPHWSLLHWMAYWAIGWQMTMTRYVVETDHILDKMFSLKAHVLPANRRAVERYLDRVWSPITELTTAFRRAERNDVVEERFRSYVSAEEDRLRTALESVRYDIDAADTLQLVTGPGRIEKFLFPLLYLLLKRDYEIMRLARTVVIHKDELWDSTDTLKWVLRAVKDRYTNLENLFKQQNLDPAQQFKVFASELFRYWHDSGPLWSTERLREAHYVELPYNDAGEFQDVDPAEILNHPIDNITDPLAAPCYYETLEDRRATGPQKAILGRWSGFLGDAEMFPSEPMLSMVFHASSSSHSTFTANGTLPIGTGFKVVNSRIVGDEYEVLYTFTVQYAARYWPKTFQGRLTDSGREFSGEWSCEANNTRGSFIFRRLPPDSMRFWPLPCEAQRARTKALAMWQFALSAIRDELRRKDLSLKLLTERQAIRQCFLRVIRAGGSVRSRDESDRQSLIRCYRGMTPSEARYYHMVHESLRRIAPQHFGISCANCHSDIYGARIMCLDCGIRTTVDLCDKPGCRDATVGPDRRDDLMSPHLPSHRILKLRRVIHRHREFGKTYRAAQAAHIRAEEALTDAEEVMAAHSLHGHFRSPSARTREEMLVNRELSCVGCKSRVSRPCWYCIECDDETFICFSCEATKVAFSGGHKPAHGLVQCAVPRDDTAKSVDLEWSHSRMDDLESKIDAFQRDSVSRFDALDGRLSVLETRSADFELRLEALQATSSQKLETLDARLERIESLLSALYSKL
ncbi:hypothetical protein BD414DRAFT_518441 [Trametes punicea]|nr:hypothetical protein BD414DRAFT_518441 [Trametes punicea]